LVQISSGVCSLSPHTPNSRLEGFHLPETLAHRTPSVACILVNWNGVSDTLACLDSLRVQNYAELKVFVVDNGSTNDSIAQIRTAHPEVDVIAAGENLGFATGVNVGLRRAYAEHFDFFWLLNNDTVCPADTCSKLVRKALANPAAGIIGSVLYYMHHPVQVQAWGGGEINTLLGRTTHACQPFLPGPKSYATFASVLLPRAVLERVGVLWEGYFMYWEDGDFALRTRAAGYGLVIAEDTAILHREGGSTAAKSPKTDRFSTTAGLHFLDRHSPLPLFSKVWFLSVRLLARVLRLHPENVRAAWAALGDYRAQRKRPHTDQL
jgi:GT2 family glycosyltransferase